MPHIHTASGQHDLTASAFIVRINEGEPKIMLHWHKKLNAYFQFGGHVELCENPWQAIAHELREESGYDLSDLKILQPKDRLKHLSDGILHPQAVAIGTYDFPGMGSRHLHSDVAYAFVAAGPPSAEVGEGESVVIKAFSRTELVALPTSQVFENMREICLYVLDDCLTHWQQVDPAEFSLENPLPL